METQAVKGNGKTKMRTIRQSIKAKMPHQGAKTVHPMGEPPAVGFRESVRNDLRGVKTAGGEAFREVTEGMLKASRELKLGFMQAGHEFAAGIDRAISKILS